MNARTLTISASTLVLAAGLLIAGPLNPSGGPVASTYKTLSEVEPGIVVNATNTPGDADSVFKITQPGRYILDRDVVGVAGKHGIEVEASHVTLDLRGFQIRGVAGSLSGIDGNGTGAGSPTSAGYVTLRHGLITGWGSNGVTASNAGAWIIEEVKFAFNTGEGITVNSGTVFTRCYFYGNSLNGAATSNHVEFNYCFASQNGGHGFSAGTNSTFQNCEAGSNGGAGFLVAILGGRAINCIATLNNGQGIFLGDGAGVENCRVDSNGREGIIVGKGGHVSKCAADANGTLAASAGIAALLFQSGSLTAATITDCVVTSNTGYGVRAQGGNVRGCTAESNGQGGIYMGAAGVVRDCAVRANTGVGIVGGQSVAVLDCTSSNNTTHGIQVSDDCQVRGNTCDSNGSAIADGAGIYVPDDTFPLATNSDNRIEDNNCSDNDVGFRLADTGNFLIKNSASGNLVNNYDIVAGNHTGTIQNSGGGSPAYAGAGTLLSNLGSSDPWANFSY